MKILFLFLFLTSMASAADWQINKDHSEILFKVPYLGVSELTGRFQEYSGSVSMNDKTEPVSVSLKINSASIDTGHKMRDNHLKANDFLGSKEHSFILFNSRTIQKTGPKLYKAIGDLTIKGIKKPFSIEFSTTDSVKDTWGYTNQFVKYKSSLNRKDFKIVWNKTLEGDKYLVGDVVEFWGVFQIQPQSSSTPSSKHMIPDTQYIREREKIMRKKNEESSISKKLRNLINGK